MANDRRSGWALWLLLLAGAACLAGCATGRSARAEKSISELAGGALLVRLPARTTRQAGPAAQDIVRAFHRNYDFSAVCYAYASDPETLYQAVMEGDSLRLVGGVPGQKEVVLLAEFGMVYDTPLTRRAGDETVPAGGVNGLPGLVVKDLSGLQLEDPFPYRVTTNYRPNDPGWAVRTLDKRLESYWLRAQRRATKRRKGSTDRARE